MGTFLPFRANKIDNQLIIDTGTVTFHLKSSLISLTVLAQKYFNNDCNRIQAQEAQKHAEEYAKKPPLSYPKNVNFAASIKTFT